MARSSPRSRPWLLAARVGPGRPAWLCQPCVHMALRTTAPVLCAHTVMCHREVYPVRTRLALCAGTCTWGWERGLCQWWAARRPSGRMDSAPPAALPALQGLGPSPAAETLRAGPAARPRSVPSQHGPAAHPTLCAQPARLTAQHFLTLWTAVLPTPMPSCACSLMVVSAVQPSSRSGTKRLSRGPRGSGGSERWDAPCGFWAGSTKCPK